jgi:hypothetical protein
MHGGSQRLLIELRQLTTVDLSRPGEPLQQTGVDHRRAAAEHLGSRALELLAEKHEGVAIGVSSLDPPSGVLAVDGHMHASDRDLGWFASRTRELLHGDHVGCEPRTDVRRLSPDVFGVRNGLGNGEHRREHEHERSNCGQEQRRGEAGPPPIAGRDDRWSRHRCGRMVK